MSDEGAIIAINKQAYQTAGHVRDYARAADDGLYRAEQLAFEMLDPEARGSVLDAGVGGGRTIAVLSRMFRHYIGIDYSAPLIEPARRISTFRWVP